MGLGEGRKRGFRSSKPVNDSKPSKVSEAYLKSHLTKEQEGVFLNYVSGKSTQTEAASRSAGIEKKIFVSEITRSNAKDLVLAAKRRYLLKKAAEAKAAKQSARTTHKAKAMESAIAGIAPRKKG